MKHWDLLPGETVTLAKQNSERRLTARFLFRTTAVGCFYIDGDFVEFKLRQSGSLREGEGVSELLGMSPGGLYNSAADVATARQYAPVWLIEGAGRNTREIISAF